MEMNFEKNETMKLLAKQYCITANSKEGNSVIELLNGMNVPITNTNIMIACNALSIGKIYGIRQERNRRAKSNG